MTQYNVADLMNILDSDFIMNPKAFAAGRRNDDVVDAMCICFALNLHFYEDVWCKHQKQCGEDDTYYQRNVLPHVERIDKWLCDKQKYQGYTPGEMDIMVYSINY